MQLTINTRAFDFPDIALPEVWTVRYLTEEPPLQDVGASARAAARSLLDDPRMKPGASVAVGVGSRGLDNLPVIVREVVSVLVDGGVRPFIVPAMGSHGGATAEGQRGILAGYGVTEDAMGVPIRATMDVVQLGALDDGYPIYFDRYAAEADAVVVVNRIKHHTDFKGPIESGLCKMCAIGLGKRQGADAIHRFGADGLRHIMPEVGRRLVQAGNVVGGVAIIENERGRTASIEHVPADGIGRAQEQALLERARRIAPRLAFDNVDVLIVDEMGKDISGTGMDTHVLGRVRMPSVPETEWDGPNTRMVVALGLTDRTHGNAAGLGLADIVTRRLMEQTDLAVTCTNHRTSQEGGAWRGGIPIVLEDAESAVRAAIGMCGRGDRTAVRVVRIRNTEAVHLLQVSAPLLDEARARNDLEVVAGPEPLNLGVPVGATT
ncbi:MAG: DUF2088 domain-containing protein [Chthonomonadales bacterium]|nr:DUF2088 domain-containing protein [Chthonomonadales bacterium]